MLIHVDTSASLKIIDVCLIIRVQLASLMTWLIRKSDILKFSALSSIGVNYIQNILRCGTILFKNATRQEKNIHTNYSTVYSFIQL